MTNANIYQDFTQIPNQFLNAIPTLGLTANQIILCLKLIKTSFGKPVFRLNDHFRNSIMVFLKVKKWDRVRRVLNLLQKKGLIFLKDVQCQIEVTFGMLLQFATTIRPDAFKKTPDFTSPLTPPNTLNNTSDNTSTCHDYNKIDKNSFIPNSMNTTKSETVKERIFSINKINESITPSKTEKDINTLSDKQTPINEPKNDIKINCQYVSTLSNHMKQHNYTDNEINIVQKEIFRANSKGIPIEKINEISKAVIYNKIDKSPKNKPIIDLKAFIISRLYSKDDKHTFQKLDHLKDFPYCEIRTLEDIQQQKQVETQKQKQVEIFKLNEEQAKTIQTEHEITEQQEKYLKNKLKDDYQKAFEAMKKELKIENNWLFVPEILAIESLYNKVSLESAETDVNEIMNTEDASIIKNNDQ